MMARLHDRRGIQWDNLCTIGESGGLRILAAYIFTIFGTVEKSRSNHGLRL